MKYLVLAMMLLLCGCQAPSKPNTEINKRYGVAANVDKFEDSEQGVVCYLYNGHGIDCIQTKQPDVE